MGPERRRLVRTVLVVVLGMHLAHCPSVSSGPDTGCVRTGKAVSDAGACNLGRVFPEPPSDSPALVLRLRHADGGVTPTAQYIDRYQSPPTDPLTVLPRLCIDECQCLRADGQECESTAATTTVTQGNPMPCAPIDLYGFDPAPPPGAGADCALDTECPGGRCVLTIAGTRQCSAPYTLSYDEAAGRHVSAPPTITPATGPGHTLLTVELRARTNSQTQANCPAAVTTTTLEVVGATTLLSPAAGATVSRGAPLAVAWEPDAAGSPAGFVLLAVRGTHAGKARTLVCRGLDTASRLTVPVNRLIALDPGRADLELSRIDATQLVAPPVEGAALLSISSQRISLTLE